MQEEAQRPGKKHSHSTYMKGRVKVTRDRTTTAATANQNPPKRKKKVKKAKTLKTLGNNPYSGVPVKSNNQTMMKARNVSPSSGFSFPGAV